jgi:hypothetical protein
LSAAVNPKAAIRVAWKDEVRIQDVLIARKSLFSSISAVVANWVPGESAISSLKYFVDRNVNVAQAYTYSGKSASAAGLKSDGESAIEINPPLLTGMKL